MLVARMSAHAQQPTADLTSYLEHDIGLNAKQRAQVERGEVVAKVLHTSIDRDVTVFAIVSVDVPRAWFIEHFAAADVPLRSPTRQRSGIFSTPAVPSDIGELTISKDEIKELKSCRPRSCHFKLSAAAMDYLSTRFDWNGDDAAARLAQLAREQAAAYVNDYRQRGAAATVIYDDNATVNANDALAGLLAEPQYIFTSAPAFQRYVVNYPAEKLDSVNTVIFWSQDQLPHTRVIHGIRQTSIYSPSNRPNATLIATKQLWADHYLEASLDMLSVVDRPGTSSGASSGVYLIAVRQFRFDNLPNNRLFSIRNRAANGLRDHAEDNLKRLKQNYEEAFRGGRAGSGPPTTVSLQPAMEPCGYNLRRLSSCTR
jgi:hypothetical protein